MQFLGNASSAISAERRRRMANYLNKDLCPLIEEKEHFHDAPPFMFGKVFKRVVRDHVESVKSLRKLSAARSGAQNLPFFRQGHPYNQTARGGLWTLPRKQSRKRSI